MTKDELIALRRERGKQELNIGDRVKVYDRDGNLMYDGKTAIIIEKALLDPTEFYYGLYVEGETADKYRGKGLLYLKNTATKIGKTALLAPFFAEDLELMSDPKPSKEQPTDEIKVGDRVVAHVGPNMDWIGTVKKIIPDTDGLYGENLLRIRVDEGCLLEHRVSRCTKIEPKKENDIDIHEEADDWLKKMMEAVDEYQKGIDEIMSDVIGFDWQQYRAELASKIAVAYAEKGRYKPSEIGEFAVMVANDVVDNLKKQSE